MLGSERLTVWLAVTFRYNDKSATIVVEWRFFLLQGFILCANANLPIVLLISINWLMLYSTNEYISD